MEFKIEELEMVGPRCLVALYEGAKHTASGLELPEKETPGTAVIGTVILAGTESKFKPGQTLFWRRYSIDTLPFSTESGEKEYSLVEDEEVVMVKK